MSTPRNAVPRLPDKPAAPPTILRETTAPERPAEPVGVLERLKAARPRAAAPLTDDAPGSPQPSVDVASGSRRPPSATPAPPGTGSPPPSARPAPPGTGSPPLSARPAPPGTGSRPPSARPAPPGTGSASGSTPEPAYGTAPGRSSGAAIRYLRSLDADLVRQVVLTLCLIACIVGSAAGVGAFGGPSIKDAAGGLFSPDATPLAPSSSAFSIWSVIYAGLVAYTVFQWLPSQRRSGRQRRLGWSVAASMLLNLAWILSAQAGALTLSLVVIVLLLLALLAAVRTMNLHPARTALEGALVDTPIGLYLGWVLLAAGANAAAFLTAKGFDVLGWQSTTWAIVGIVAILLTAAVVCSTDRGRLAVAAATSWGLLWIAVERVVGEPSSLSVALTAALGVFVLLITAGSRRHRVDHAHRRRLRAQEDAQREPLDLLGDDDEDARS